MIEIHQCPLCKSNDLQKDYIKTKDYFLSNEEFSISKCRNCSFQFTDPRPANDQLDRYYQSEEYLSHDPRISSLKDWLYRLIKRYSLKTKYKLVVKYSGKSKGDILDYGCGTGELLHYFSMKDWNAFGVEPNEKARKSAKEKPGLKVFSSAGELINTKMFDVIMLWHVIEHLPLLHENIDQLKSKLKPGGRIFIAIPNVQSPDSEYYGKYWAALDLPRHLYHFNKETFTRFAHDKKLQLDAVLPMKFDSFYVSLLSEKYKNSKLQYIKAFYQGLRSNLQALGKNNFSSLVFVLK